MRVYQEEGGRAVVDKETEALVKKDGIQLLQLETSLSILKRQFSSLKNERQRSDYLKRVDDLCEMIRKIESCVG